MEIKCFTVLITGNRYAIKACYEDILASKKYFNKPQVYLQTNPLLSIDLHVFQYIKIQP